MHGSKRLWRSFLLLLLSLLIGCGMVPSEVPAVQASTPQPASSAAPVTEEETVLVRSEPEETPIPTPTPTASPTPSPSPTPEPEHITAAMLDEGLFDSYFDDALFIGDSLVWILTNYVRGMRQKNEGYLGGAQFMGTVSMSVKNASTNKAYPGSITFTYHNKAVSVTEGIQKSGAKKAFIMLGLNDIGFRNWDDVQQYFATLIEVIQTECPETEIVMMGILPVTSSYCKKNSVKIARWNSFNEILSGICEAHNVDFLNFADLLKNDDGYLKSAYASGDFHLNEDGEAIWIRSLRAYAAAKLHPDATVDYP